MAQHGLPLRLASIQFAVTTVCIAATPSIDDSSPELIPSKSDPKSTSPSSLSISVSHVATKKTVPSNTTTRRTRLDLLSALTTQKVQMRPYGVLGIIGRRLFIAQSMSTSTWHSVHALTRGFHGKFIRTGMRISSEVYCKSRIFRRHVNFVYFVRGGFRTKIKCMQKIQSKAETPQRSTTVRKFHAYERSESPGYEN